MRLEANLQFKHLCQKSYVSYKNFTFNLRLPNSVVSENLIGDGNKFLFIFVCYSWVLHFTSFVINEEYEHSLGKPLITEVDGTYSIRFSVVFFIIVLITAFTGGIPHCELP